VNHKRAKDYPEDHDEIAATVITWSHQLRMCRINVFQRGLEIPGGIVPFDATRLSSHFPNPEALERLRLISVTKPPFLARGSTIFTTRLAVTKVVFSAAMAPFPFQGKSIQPHVRVDR
jgi:hypothetical protein